MIASYIWLYLIILVILSLAGFIFHRIAIGRMKQQKGELQRQLTECCEIKQYAVKNAKNAREEAEFANRNKSELLAMISHDVRTPMNAMLGMASLLNETTLTEEQQEYSTAILNSGESLITIINDILLKDILQHSKVELGNELEFNDFDLHTAVEEVLEVLGSKGSRTTLDLLYEIDDKVPAQITGDPQRLRQILTNLVENAFRFTTDGEIFIGVRVADARYDDKLILEFEVRDTGKGMTAEILRQVSHELALPDNGDSASGVLGLPLIICKRLVNMMGGAIKVESTEEEGTVFRFTICVSKSNKPMQKYVYAEMVSQLGKKVLITDDNKCSAGLLKRQLQEWKLQPSVAESAEQALQILAQDPAFELVLCDLNMPGTNGVELAKQIKKQSPKLPVILLSSADDDSFRKHPELFTAAINKPVRQHLLSKEVVKALNPKGSDKLKSEKISTDFSRLYPLNILIAEDDAMNQKMVTMVLKKLGYNAQIASNGKEVLEVVSQRTFDLILMDIQMPEMDGLEATRMIRLCLSTQPVIIAMTANSLQGDREDCLKAGMDDYLSKPVKLTELVNVLEKWALQEQQKNVYRVPA
jgi:CheY-like chemotaxis protein